MIIEKQQPTLADVVGEALTSHEYNDVTGCVTVNVTDALMAIANGINRLALSQEKLVEVQGKLVECQALMAQRATQQEDALRQMLLQHSNGPGHA